MRWAEVGWAAAADWGCWGRRGSRENRTTQSTLLGAWEGWGGRESWGLLQRPEKGREEKKAAAAEKWWGRLRWR